MHCRSAAFVSATGRDILGNKKSQGKKSHKKPVKTKGVGGLASSKGGNFYNDVRDPTSQNKKTTADVAGRWFCMRASSFWVLLPRVNQTIQLSKSSPYLVISARGGIDAHAHSYGLHS